MFCKKLECQIKPNFSKDIIRPPLVFFFGIFEKNYNDKIKSQIKWTGLYCFVPCFKMEIRYFFVFDFLEHISSIPFFSSLNLQVYIPKIKIAKHFRLLLIILTEHDRITFLQSDLVDFL